MSLDLPPQTEQAILHLAAVIRGRQGGLAKGKKKTLAVRRNGKLGGRPVKKAA